MNLTLDDLDYPLPPERIAQAPLVDRTASRLLVMRGGTLEGRLFADLPGLLAPGGLLVLNDSRVLHARLLGRKASGGQIEVLVERPLGDREVLAQVRASKPPKPGSRLRLEEAFDVEVAGREGEFYRLHFPGSAVELIERHGRLPLPPYIERAAQDGDEARYQTVFARERGSVMHIAAGIDPGRSRWSTAFAFPLGSCIDTRRAAPSPSPGSKNFSRFLAACRRNAMIWAGKRNEFIAFT